MGFLKIRCPQYGISNCQRPRNRVSQKLDVHFLGYILGVKTKWSKNCVKSRISKNQLCITTRRLLYVSLSPCGEIIPQSLWVLEHEFPKEKGCSLATSSLSYPVLNIIFNLYGFISPFSPFSPTIILSVMLSNTWRSNFCKTSPLLIIF